MCCAKTAGQLYARQSISVKSQSKKRVKLKRGGQDILVDALEGDLMVVERVGEVLVGLREMLDKYCTCFPASAGRWSRCPARYRLSRAPKEQAAAVSRCDGSRQG